MITPLFLWIPIFNAVTSHEVLFACQYPGCKCLELSDNPPTFSLTCNVTSGQNVNLLPRNSSVNVTRVSLNCEGGHHDPDLFLNALHQDLVYVEELKIHNCVTSLVSVFKNHFFSLSKLSLHNVSFLDESIGEHLNEKPQLKVLEITGSKVIFPQIWSMAHLSTLVLNFCDIRFPNDTESDPNKSLELKHIDLSHNELKAVPFWIAWASELLELDLRHNKITVIPEETFNETLNLNSLDISHNSLTFLPDDVFTQLSALQYLNLSCNDVTSLPENLLASNTNLTRLDLSFNRVRYLDSGFFRSLHSLNFLNLSSNAISFLLTSHLRNLENLLYLDLGSNNLMNIPVLNVQKRLKVLDLRNNRIKSILSSSLRGVVSLEGISLRHNLLTTLRLQSLAVSTKLVIIDVSYNSLVHIDYRSEVDVSVDLTVNDSLSVLGSVEILFLNNNQLKDVYRLSRVFTGVHTLLLDYNNLTSIHSSDFPPSVDSLGLSNNHIRYIEPNVFKSFPRLRAVTLQFNYPYLTSLPAHAISTDKNADPKPEMFIAGNLYMCDCRMAFLRTYAEADKFPSFKYYSKNLPKIPDLPNVLCITEHDNTVRRLIDIPAEEFLCVSEEVMCEFFCSCCIGRKSKICPCEHHCPSPCTCSQGGSPFEQFDYKVHCTNSSLSSVPEDIPTPTTYLHLEHTNITSLQKDQFSDLVNLKYLYLFNSQISNLTPGCFNGLNQLTHLDLHDNSIRHLTPSVMTGLWNLTHLYLQNNLLELLEPGTFSQLAQLQYLDLSHNQLLSLSVDSFPDLSSPAIFIIDNNPFSCSCQDLFDTVPFFTIYGSNIDHYESLTCLLFSNSSYSIVSRSEDEYQTSPPQARLLKDFDMDICNRSKTFLNETHFDSLRYERDNRYAVTLSTFSVLFVVAVVAAIVLYRRRSELQAWMFVKFGVRLRPKNAGLDETGRHYDAFVSYSSHDERLVVHELAPRLEEGRGETRGLRQYHLCLHYRDFPVGDSIADTIIESIEASKRTIMLLSDNFLESEWCRYEFQTAHHHVLKERSHRLIIVLLHEIDDRKLDPDLRVHLNEGNFLRYDDPWFWEKLYFALPDVPVDRKAKGQKLEKKKDVVENDLDMNFNENEVEVRFTNIQLQ